MWTRVPAAAAAVLMLLFLYFWETSLAGFPNQINIGKFQSLTPDCCIFFLPPHIFHIFHKCQAIKPRTLLYVFYIFYMPSLTFVDFCDMK